MAAPPAYGHRMGVTHIPGARRDMQSRHTVFWEAAKWVCDRKTAGFPGTSVKWHLPFVILSVDCRLPWAKHQTQNGDAIQKSTAFNANSIEQVPFKFSIKHQLCLRYLHCSTVCGPSCGLYQNRAASLEHSGCIAYTLWHHCQAIVESSHKEENNPSPLCSLGAQTMIKLFWWRLIAAPPPLFPQCGLF